MVGGVAARWQGCGAHLQLHAVVVAFAERQAACEVLLGAPAAMQAFAYMPDRHIDTGHRQP